MDRERAAIAARRMMVGRNIAAAVADQYGYGRGYSYTRQAPSWDHWRY
jgi:hypothetical protein